MCNLSVGVLNKGKMEQAKAMAYRLWKKGMSCEEIARLFGKIDKCRY